MLRNVFLKTIRDQRKSFMWWSFGLSLLMILTMLFYPSIADSPEYDDLLDKMPEALAKLFIGEVSELTSPAGYLNSQLFVLLVPLMFLFFSIARGSVAIAGEEERGTLDLLLSFPLRRSQVVMEKFAAMVVAILALAFVLWLSMSVGAVAIGMEISLGRLAEATLSGALLGLTFGALALALGCATGKLGFSTGVASALGVVAYFFNALAPLVEVLGPSRKLSPFYYYMDADPLTNGLNSGHVAALIGLTVALLAVALIAFNRRDLVV